MRKKFKLMSIWGFMAVVLMFCIGLFAIGASNPKSLLGMTAMPLVFGMAMGATSDIEKSVKCTAAIAAAFTIAKFGADDDTLSAATASTEELIGIFQYTTSAAGDEVRVMVSGISKVKLGGTVTRGAWLTSDASAQGIAATPGAGVNAAVIGKALASGVSGDIIPVLLCPGRIQG